MKYAISITIVIIFLIVVTSALLSEDLDNGIITYYVEPFPSLQNYTMLYDGKINVDEDIVTASFSEWMYLNPKLEFVQVYNENEAVIKIHWEEKVKFVREPMTVYRIDDPYTGQLVAGLTETDGYNSDISIDYVDVDCEWNDIFKSKDTLKRTLTHEIGHTLGLDHSSDEKNIMYAKTEIPYDFDNLGYVIPFNNESYDWYVGEKELFDRYELIGLESDMDKIECMRGYSIT